jgi:hypothetical protein
MRALVLVVALGACDDVGGTSTEISVDVTAPGRAIPDDFLGLSVEWNSVRAYLGDGTGHARAPLVTLIGAFAAEGHHPQIRIGGNSEDRSWWNPTGASRPTGVDYDLQPIDLDTLADLQSQTGSKLVLGVNLVLGDADNAAALITAARAAIPSAGLDAFELGNEPDVYASDGRRPSTYDWNAYLTDEHGLRDAIAARLTPPALQFPAIARHDWLSDLATAIPAEGATIVSTHTYPYTACSGAIPPPPDALLDPVATIQIASSYEPLAHAALAAGVPYRMGEMNSVSCGGAAGISDVFASALWGADVSMQLAEVGASGVDFHGGAPPGTRSYYAPIELDASGNPIARPLYDGLRMVSLVTAAHARLASVYVDPTEHIDAFATIGDDGAVRVLAIRLGTDGPDAIRVSVAGATARTATLVRLHAPALDASDGVTITTEPADAGGTFSLPPYDAVVITLAP